MSDPLQDPPVTPHIAQLKFAKLHSPKMKSVYWRHFGFPTNEDNCIITKHNIVCILCHKVLTNHGNTTNLRAHLQYRHKEVFNQIVQENGIQVPPRKTQTKMSLNGGGVTKIKREQIERKPKVKLEYQHHTSMIQDTYSNDASASGNDDHTILYETVVPMTYEDDDVVDNNHFTKIEVTSGHDIKPSCSELIQMNRNVERAKYRITSVNNNNNSSNMIHEPLDNYELQEALTNLVVDDIRNVESLYDPSMTKFINTLCGNVTIPSVKKIELYIKELHSDKYTTLSDQIKVHSQIKPYSLGFEMWTNVEQKQFLSIFFNYTTDAPAYNLVNQIYCTIEYNKYTAIDALFEEFNLQNCTAAIINCDYDDYLKHFLNRKGIPVILSYDTIVNYCIKNVIALPAVASVIEEIKDTIMRYNAEINSKDVEIPTVSDEFPWTYYELLKFFAETLFWPEELEVLVASAKGIYDILSTLSVTLDTLKGEDIPLSSMLSPITSKVLTKKLAVNENDDNFVEIIKTTISNTLHKLVLSDNHLTIAALLDPRFHRLISINNLASCVKILTEKYNKIIESQGISPCISSPGSAQNRAKSTNTNVVKKSNLELFFDLTESPVEQPVLNVPSSVETDLKRYRTDVFCSLDESPFLWWNRMGHLYGSLKHLAYQYQCVPCVVNMNYRKNIKQQMLESQKRYTLTGNLIDAILFLHYN